jgi:homocysteine S-methyltransferase
VLDGGLATELEKRGFDLNDRLWSARALKDAPELIFETHYDFLRAGADIILTASYQASIKGFVEKGMYVREARETIFSSVMLACMAREKYIEESGPAAKRPILIGASIGPYAATLADMSEYSEAKIPVSPDKLQEYYEPKIEALLSPRKNFRVDFLAFETMPSLAEVKYVLNFMKRFPGARMTICFSRVEEALRGHQVLDGDPQVASWGLNCLSAAEITDGLRQLAAIRTRNGTQAIKPLMAYSNGTANWSQIVPDWRAAGAHLIGGCCKTGPDDVAQIAKFG